jgi:hypothetical protein
VLQLHIICKNGIVGRKNSVGRGDVGGDREIQKKTSDEAGYPVAPGDHGYRACCRVGIGSKKP